MKKKAAKKYPSTVKILTREAFIRRAEDIMENCASDLQSMLLENRIYGAKKFSEGLVEIVMDRHEDYYLFKSSPKSEREIIQKAIKRIADIIAGVR